MPGTGEDAIWVARSKNRVVVLYPDIRDIQVLYGYI